MTLKVLYLGGTGVISSACSALAVEKGMDLYLFNSPGSRGGKGDCWGY